MGLEAARITIEGHLAKLARARELAIAHGQIAAGVQAEHYRGKAAGLYQDRLLLASGPTDAELVARIEELMGKEVAEAVKVVLGEP